MSTTFEVWAVILVALVAANLPFVNDRLFLVGPQRHPKSLLWRLIELLVLGGAVLGVGWLFEARLGVVHEQNWEFYVAAASLFFTFAFPGFVWRYLRRGAGRESAEA
jgi:hypothetical protein